MSKLTLPDQEPQPDQGLQFLEQKLSVYVHGRAGGRRNPALDVLVGRVPDGRLAPLAASINESAHARQSPWLPCPPRMPQPEAPQVADARANGPEPELSHALPGARTPSTVVLPLAAVRMAAVARAKRSGSPWLAPTAPSLPTLRLMQPPRESWWRRLRRRLAALLQPD